MVIRRHFALEKELDALRQLAEDERRRALDGPLLELSPEQVRELQEFQSLSLKEAEALSKDLSKRGFKFVGSTICYAFMQAVGMVNDHTVDCFRHSEIKRQL